MWKLCQLFRTIVLVLSVGMWSATMAAAEQTAQTQKLPLKVSAIIAKGGKPLAKDVSYTLERFGGGGSEIVATATGGRAVMNVPPGSYRLVTAFGAARVFENIEVNGKTKPHVVNLNAGEISLKLIPGVGRAAIKKPIIWSVYSYGKDASGKRVLLHETQGATANLVLSAGWYYILARNDERVTKHTIEVSAGQRYKYTLIEQ